MTAAHVRKMRQGVATMDINGPHGANVRTFYRGKVYTVRRRHAENIDTLLAHVLARGAYHMTGVREFFPPRHI